MWKLLTINIPVWIALILVLALGGMYLLHRYESAEIKEQAKTILLQEVEIKTQNATIEKNKLDIKNLQDKAKEDSKILADSQRRIGQIVTLAGSFNKPVPLTPTTQVQLGVVNKKDSDKVINWINEEIFK